MRSALPRLLAVLGLLLGMAGMCFAQSPPFPQTLPDHTLVGRLGSGTGSGPAQAIPFATASQQLFGAVGSIAPNVPQPHPASGNLLCPSGFNGTVVSSNHVLTWSDQSECWTNDAQLWTSFDPSALLTIALSGTPNTGDVETITFHYGAAATTVQYTTKVSDTATIVAGCLTDATISGCSGTGNVGIKQAGAGLYNNVAGSQGQILYVTTTGATIDIDWNSAVSMYLSNTSTGSRISYAYGGTNGSNTCSSGTPCIAGLDNNPVQEIERCASSGTSPPCVVPAPGSIIWSQQFIGASSTGNADTTYGQITEAIANSTTATILGKMEFTNKNHSGTDAFFLSNGLCTSAYACEGLDSWDTGAYWIAALHEINDSGTVWTFAAGASHPIEFTSAGGFGFGLSPTAADFETAVPLTVFNTSPLPAGGSAWTLTGGASPTSYCENWGTSTYLNCIFLGLSFDFKPSNSTGGMTVAANAVTPDTNNATTLGGSSNRWSTTYTVALNATGTATMADSGTWGSGGVAGTTINNSAIGGSTPAAGKFTSLNASGQITSTAGLPTIASGACGATTNGAVVSGSTNQSGQITIGSAATTTCTISWSATLAVAPNACVFFPMNAAAAATGTTVARVGAPSTTQVVLTGSALANANYAYVCL